VTGQEFSEVDFDLLADYVGGALDGTPEEAVVARRVAEEPVWAEAHAVLSEATGSVRASLASWGESAEPMPAEVADQIATALAQEPHRPALSVVPDDPDGPSRTAPRARRRLPSWAAPAAIAAGVAALAGLGLSQASNLGGGSDDSGSGTSAEAPAVANAEGDPGMDTYVQREVPLAASGENYRAATLASANTPMRALSAAPNSAAERDQSRADLPSAPPLDRLKDAAALAACIEAIARAHPPGVTDVEVVDLASFEGSPAALVFFTDGSGARWIWASGPECGLAARGADTRGSAQIG
jgi:negative regulator of sigma E activity